MREEVCGAAERRVSSGQSARVENGLHDQLALLDTVSRQRRVAGLCPDGEFTLKASASGTIAAAVNGISPDSAMGYTATGSPAPMF